MESKFQFELTDHSISANGKLGDVVVFEIRQTVTEAKFINKNSLFILLPGIIRRLELKPVNVPS
jgi:hypothetical protein